MGKSVGFDRAAGYYDRTRALPPEVMGRVTELLVEEVAGRGRVLEIGVGTGRIALPLAAAGPSVVGVDLSAAMLGQLRVKDPAGVPVVQADATRLPFAEDRFGAALAWHVLHLIQDWRVAMAELARVLQSGGVVLACRGGGWSPAKRALSQAFFEAAGMPGETPVGAATLAEVDAAAAHLGWGVRHLDPVTWPTKESPAEWVDQLEAGLFSVTWSLDDAARRRAAEAVRRDLVARHGRLDVVTDSVAEVRWRAYDLP